MADGADSASVPLPTPCLVVLVGAPASGKSHWAAENFRPDQVVSSDRLRAVVGEHELDLDATADAFEILDRVIDMRLGRRLTTVVDTTGLDDDRRRGYVRIADDAGLPAVAVRFTTSAAECRRRNRERDHPVPARALDTMLARAKEIELDGEGWHTVIEPEPVRTVTPKLAAVPAPGSGGRPPPEVAESSAGEVGPVVEQAALSVGLMISRFDWPGGSEALPDTLAAIGRRAEDAGVESFWVMDHLLQIPQLGREWDPMLEPYTTLTHVAAATSTIKLGVLVSPVTSHHVARLAKLIATVDVLSGGRMIAGLGSGSSPREHEQFSLPFGPTEHRLAQLDDSVRALAALLGPGGKPFAGSTLWLPSTGLYPRPVQDKVPIYVGGSGERVTLRIAAEHADGCNLFGDLERVRRLVEVVRRHCATVDRDPAEVRISHLGDRLIGLDRSDLADRIERCRPANVGPDRFADRAKAGTVDDHVADLRRYAAAGVETAIVSLPELHRPDALDPLAAVIEALPSTPPSGA